MKRISNQKVTNVLFGDMLRIEKYLANIGIERKLRELVWFGLSERNGFSHWADNQRKKDIRQLTSFSKDEIANLTLAIAPINSWSRLMPKFSG